MSHQSPEAKPIPPTQAKSNQYLIRNSPYKTAKGVLAVFSEEVEDRVESFYSSSQARTSQVTKIKRNI